MVDPGEETESAIDILNNSLASLINDGSEGALINLNGGLIYLLYNVDGFKNLADKAIITNPQKITHKKFSLDAKELSPSVENWLKHFILVQGTGMFNNLELTKFISESDNGKRLNDGEKRAVSKLLQTYRNIKFFPRSMQDLPPEQWEIIPIEKKEEPSRVPKIDKTQKSGREALIDELKGNINDYAQGSLEREILEEETEKDREHHKLLLLAKKYPEGSLERKAVEDEIGKLER